MEEHGRRPDKHDVSATRIPWLVRAASCSFPPGRLPLFQKDTYHEYSVLKRKLLLRTLSLRGALAVSARAELPQPGGL